MSSSHPAASAVILSELYAPLKQKVAEGFYHLLKKVIKLVSLVTQTSTLDTTSLMDKVLVPLSLWWPGTHVETIKVQNVPKLTSILVVMANFIYILLHTFGLNKTNGVLITKG